MTTQQSVGAQAVYVCKVGDLAPGEARKVDVRPAIAVFNVEGEFYATSDLCSHDKSSLTEEGFIEGDQVECGWHYARFCIRTGAVEAMPAVTPLAKYETRIDGDDLYVLVPTTDTPITVHDRSAS